MMLLVQTCECVTGVADCDAVTGRCKCAAGWTGRHCNISELLLPFYIIYLIFINISELKNRARTA